MDPAAVAGFAERLHHAFQRYIAARIINEEYVLNELLCTMRFNDDGTYNDGRFDRLRFAVAAMLRSSRAMEELVSVHSGPVTAFVPGHDAMFSP